MQGQEFDSDDPVGSFQTGIFCDSEWSCLGNEENERSAEEKACMGRGICLLSFLKRIHWYLNGCFNLFHTRKKICQ